MAKPPPRLYLEQDLGRDQVVALSSDHAHYLSKVLRLDVGADVMAFNGRDGEWRVSLAEISRRGGVATCAEQLRAQSNEPDVTLLFAPVKKAPTEFLVQKATELGVSTLQPIQTRRTIEPKRSPRWEMIVVEAAEQSERLSVPTISDIMPLESALAAFPDRWVMFADEAGDDPDAKWGGVEGRAGSALGALADAPREGAWSILVGPAGGFTPDEREMVRALPRCVPVSLGPRILKAETAAVVALTLWQAARGDFS